MRNSLIKAYNMLDEQSQALAEAHLMDEGSTMRIIELGKRGELAEQGAAHIVQESMAMRDDTMQNWKVQLIRFENNVNNLRLWLNTFDKMDYNFARHAHSMSTTGKRRTERKWNH